MTYVPHFPCTIQWAIPHTVFTEEAAEKQVGETFLFCGTEVVITRAWVEIGDMFLTVDKKEEANDTTYERRESFDGFDLWVEQVRPGALRHLSE